MFNWRTVLFLFFVAVFYGVFFIGSVKGATTDTVTATVTAQNISVSISDGVIAYGTLALNSTQSTIGLTDTQTVTNDGNVNEDFDIRGFDSANWVLDSTNATQDHYIHRFCTATCTSPPTNYTALTTNYQTLDSAVAPLGTTSLDLEITTPQSVSVYTQQTVDVTVQASAS